MCVCVTFIIYNICVDIKIHVHTQTHTLLFEMICLRTCPVTRLIFIICIDWNVEIIRLMCVKHSLIGSLNNVFMHWKFAKYPININLPNINTDCVLWLPCSCHRRHRPCERTLTHFIYSKLPLHWNWPFTVLDLPSPSVSLSHLYWLFLIFTVDKKKKTSDYILNL